MNDKHLQHLLLSQCVVGTSEPQRKLHIRSSPSPCWFSGDSQQDSPSYLNKNRPLDRHDAGPSEQVNTVLQQSVSGLAGQRESTVLVVRDARVPQRSPVLLEVSLLSHTAGPIHGSPGAPAAGKSHAFTFQRHAAENS